MHDFFFEAAPRWTVGNALNRILTKMTVQKFVKDSCKGNLKRYFTAVRNSMPHPDQLTKGDKPYLEMSAPKSKPRTRAAAVSEEGFAYKDYTVQVTKAGFEAMSAKMNLDGPDPQNLDDGDEEPPTKKRRLQSARQTPRKDLALTNSSLTPATNPPGFVPRITEQEQEAANNMLLFVKASTDGFLATVHHLRTENDVLKKENLALKFVNASLLDDVRLVKLQLASLGIIAPNETEPLYSHPELGAQLRQQQESQPGEVPILPNDAHH